MRHAVLSIFSSPRNLDSLVYFIYIFILLFVCRCWSRVYIPYSRSSLCKYIYNNKVGTRQRVFLLFLSSFVCCRLFQALFFVVLILFVSIKYENFDVIRLVDTRRRRRWIVLCLCRVSYTTTRLIIVDVWKDTHGQTPTTTTASDNRARKWRRSTINKTCFFVSLWLIQLSWLFCSGTVGRLGSDLFVFICLWFGNTKPVDDVFVRIVVVWFEAIILINY